MTDLRKAAEMALEVLTLINQDFEKHRATLPIGRQSELCKASLTLRQALAQTEKPPVKSYCGGKPNYCTPEVTTEVTGDVGACVTCGAPKSEWLVDGVNISAERVDETAKSKHEPWPSVQCVCGGTIYFKYTPPISDYHEGWEEGFKAAKGEHEPFIYVREDNERPFGGYEHCSEADAGAFPVYTAPMIYTPPPKREWVGLTDEEMSELANKYKHIETGWRHDMDLIAEAEAKLKERNGWLT